MAQVLIIRNGNSTELVDAEPQTILRDVIVNHTRGVERPCLKIGKALISIDPEEISHAIEQLEAMRREASN